MSTFMKTIGQGLHIVITDCRTCARRRQQWIEGVGFYMARLEFEKRIFSLYLRSAKPIHRVVKQSDTMVKVDQLVYLIHQCKSSGASRKWVKEMPPKGSNEQRQRRQLNARFFQNLFEHKP